MPFYVPDVPIYRVGPQTGGPLSVPDVPNNREGPQAREASKCLNGQSYGEDWPKRPSDHQLQEARKKTAAAAAKSHRSCLTLCDPKDGSPLGSAIPGILQARALEWAAISSSSA